MINRCVHILLLLFVASAQTGCDFIASLAPGKVSDGVGRLSVRNMATLLRAVTEDSSCGFMSNQVIESQVAEGEPGKNGSVTWTVENCQLDFGDGKEVMKDCHGVAAEVFGKVKISAKRIVYGRLTGNKLTPVVPEKPDAVTVEMVADFEGFGTRFSSDENSMTHTNGSITAFMRPHLAVSQVGEKKGLCAVPTSDLTVDSIQYTESNVYVKNGWFAFNVPLQASNFKAQVGKWDNQENMLDGTITAYGKERTLPGDAKGLDPEYDAEKLIGSFSCNEELAGIVSYECASLNEKLGLGLAPLSSLAFAQIADVVDLDRDCGFSSIEALKTAKLTGDRGYEGGEAIFEIKDCEIDLSKKPQPVFNDCNGVNRFASGFVTVSGTKKVKGILVHNAQSFAQKVAAYESLSRSRDRRSFESSLKPEAIVPNDYEPAEVSLTISFDKFEVTDACTMEQDPDNKWHCSRQNRFKQDLRAAAGQDNIKEGPLLSIDKGEMTGTIIPRMAKNTDATDQKYGICGEKVPLITFKNITYNPSDLRLKADGNEFAIHVESAEINAMSGKKDNVSNVLKGFIMVDDSKVELGSDDKPGALDPFYDEEGFYNSFTSCKKIDVPKQGSDCSPLKVLAENAARLIILNAGGVVKLVNQEDSLDSIANKSWSSFANWLTLNNSEQPEIFACGFKSISTLMSPTLESIGNGDQRVRFGIKKCLVDTSFAPMTKKDCHGKAMGFEGSAKISGTMTLEGAQVNNFFGQPAIVFNAALNQRNLLPPMLNVDMKKPDSVVVALNSVRFNNFSAFELEDGNSEPVGKLRIKSGFMTALVEPLVGESSKKFGSYFVETPVATFRNVILSEAEVELEANGMLFALTIPSATLNARNGFFKGDGNYIVGNIVVGSAENQKEFKIENLPLVPLYPYAYNQTYFDDSYSCFEGLKQTIASR